MKVRTQFIIPAAAAILSGCASHQAGQSYPQAVAGIARMDDAAVRQRLQCVPYAREHSQVKIHGDAWTWWEQAAGRYERGPAPASGSVMVLHNYAGPNRGHLAVVRRIVSPREIRIDHANWLNDGSIYLNNPVVDVSAANDWSLIRVFNLQTGAWGGRTYPVQGFIGTGTAPVPPQMPPIDTLIADLAASSPGGSGGDDRNPPAHSPFALTADDLAIEGH